MPKKFLLQFISIIISISLFFSFMVAAQSPILDENGTETGLININPDPNGELWIAGGIKKEAWDESTAKLPELKITDLGTRPRAPDKVNNSVLDAFRPIFNQKGGSCAQASAIGYVFTYEINTARGLAANTLANQYPYDFTYNFCNSGSGSNGSMPNQGFDIAVKLGIPDADAYGGFGLGDHDRWVSGYDVYLNAMGNRGSDHFTINVGDESGISTMREWLDNHGTGSDDGGCLVFCYNASGCNEVSLASGTPEAGKKAYTAFGSSGGHAVTIAGYNDSVRYDYNGDGQYTNTLDINGDRAVTVEDWEIGAVIMVNSWGSGFGDNGRIYVMYRLCANGGMWSQRVYGINAIEETVQPKLTFKTTIEHSSRSTLEIRAGMSNNISATSPSETINFGKAFDNAGGAYEMGGSGTPSIEIGLDATELFDMMTGKQAKFFLQVKSEGAGSGQVEKFSIIDYTSGAPIETICDQQNVDISSSGTYYLSIVLSGGPQIVVTSPNGGEQWEQSSSKDITWGDNIDGNVKIELLKGGSVAETIAASTESDGIYTWEIPGDQQTGADFKIRVTSVDSTALFDESDENFSITEEYIIVCPYFQNFDTLTAKTETLPFKYEQLATDDHNWTVYNGPTPSRIDDPPDVTGPMADHTTGTDQTNYLYTEASASEDGNPNKKFDFVTPKFNFKGLQNPELTFWYHMFSDNAGEDHMGTLSLDVNVDGTWHSDVVTITGNQGDNWLEKKVDLTPYKGDRVILRFRAVTGDSWESDISIDDLRIEPSTPIVNGITNVSSTYDLTFHNSRIYFKVPESAAKDKVQVRLYNLHGKLIKVLANSDLDAGIYSVSVHDLATGLYLCRMEAGDIKRTINVMLIK